MPEPRVQVQGSDCESEDIDRFLTCTNCGWAYPIDSMFEGEACYECDGELAVRVMPKETP